MASMAENYLKQYLPCGVVLALLVLVIGAGYYIWTHRPGPEQRYRCPICEGIGYIRVAHGKVQYRGKWHDLKTGKLDPDPFPDQYMIHIEKRVCPGCRGEKQIPMDRIRELEKTKAYKGRHGNRPYEKAFPDGG